VKKYIKDNWIVILFVLAGGLTHGIVKVVQMN
jgi:hypothetical protein